MNPNKEMLIIHSKLLNLFKNLCKKYPLESWTDEYQPMESFLEESMHLKDALQKLVHKYCHTEEIENQFLDIFAQFSIDIPPILYPLNKTQLDSRKKHLKVRRIDFIKYKIFKKKKLGKIFGREK